MRPTVSIVVPVYDEAGAIEPFVAAVSAAVEGVDADFEVVFVDDGSTDETTDEVRTVSRRSSVPVRLVALSRNFGKEAALTAGIDAARGDAVIPMDVDLQDPPELIPQFIGKWREGYKVVYGRRMDRASDSWMKRSTAGAFYRLFNSMSQTDIPPNAGDFRLIDRAVVDALHEYRERTRFMKGLLSFVGFKTCHIDYSRPARKVGRSKWNYWKLWNFALDGILSFSAVPLRVWTYVGALIAGLSFLYAVFIIMMTMIFGTEVPGYASIITIILFMGGIQLISLGILGEYIARIFLETKQRPIYTIDHSRSELDNGPF
jgi:glycosyltransferase involved in cell wall biosynthesis